MTVPQPKTTALTTVVSDTSSHPTITPEFTPSSTPGREHHATSLENNGRMETSKAEGAVDKEQPETRIQETEVKTESANETKGHSAVEKKTKCCSRHHKSCEKSKSKKSKKEESSSESDSSSDSSSSDSEKDEDDSDSQESSSDDEKTARRRRKAKRKSKKSKRRSRRDPSSSEDEDDEDEESSEEEQVRHKKRSKKIKKSRRVEESEESEAATDENDQQQTAAQLRALQLENVRLQRQIGRGGIRTKTKKAKGKHGKKASSKPQYFRGDELWDREIHDYRLTPTSERVDEDDYGEYIFHVRRRFDWEGKYTDTVVDIKSKTLRGCLKHVMASCKLVSLAEDTPTIDPGQLFLYLEDIRTYRKDLKGKLKNEKKKKTKKTLKEQIGQLKCLLKYLDKDYATTKKTLYPMLEAGNITFDLLWTLFRSETICYTSTYTAHDEPRAFKVEYATKESSFVKGTWVEVEGRYMDFDGKTFGLGSMDVEIESFKGPRKINSLPCYPLKYHKDPEAIKARLIARGKKFTELAGMQYKFHKGLSFTKRKRQAIKVTTNGRVMIDPATFRRTNPNYPISTVKPPDPGLANSLGIGEDSDSEGGCCCGDSDEEEVGRQNTFEDANDEPRKESRLILDKSGKAHFVEVEVDEHGMEIKRENMEKIPEGSEKQREFTEEELLIASPVVLGFAFSEKLWLEFTVSGIHDIEWNEGAFESLVLPEKQKSIVKALVQSHTSEAAERKNIDDVIQGKGRGLVAVLHGTPGVGKTLTAESIAELLKCPLYCVSAGELGTNPRELEQELQKILDLAHSWGAVLLLDEADVFLEARTAQDIHRNALVSIFLRLLEYFQGILFLTTNRVTTFDDAFQSRIHIALRYQELDFKARRAIFSMFLNRVASLQAKKAQFNKDGGASSTKSDSTTKSDSDNSSTSNAPSELPASTSTPSSPTKSSSTSTTAPSSSPAPPKLHSFSDSDLDRLARRANLNGRQIKNAVRSAQALAVNAGEPLGIAHLLQVLDVAESFERDLKGGTGYTDAMRSYM